MILKKVDDPILKEIKLSKHENAEHTIDIHLEGEKTTTNK